MNDEHVIARVDRETNSGSEHPIVRQWLRPHAIDFVNTSAVRIAVLLRAGDGLQGVLRNRQDGDQRSYGDANVEVAPIQRLSHGASCLKSYSRGKYGVRLPAASAKGKQIKHWI